MMRFGKAVRIGGYGALVALLAFVSGFAYFTVQVPKQQGAAGARADGIVVLTGGASRITDAVQLLRAGNAERLLISGVNPGTTRQDLRRRIRNSKALFDCCIDIGRSAEAKAWAKDLHFTSIIVVTSNYHLPRSLSEFAHAMPDITLVPYPVVPEAFREKAWWRDPETWRMLFVEYLKFIASKGRQTFVDTNTGSAATAADYFERTE